MKIALQTLASALFGVAFFAVALFVPAGTLAYWQAWVFITVFLLATLVPSIHLAVHDPAALQRRLKAGPAAEARPVQRVIISATVLLVIATLVVAALDHRFGWSSVPLWVGVVGDVLVAVGLLLAHLVVVQNGYASANITVEDGQPLVSTGLYGIVRHPMYMGALVMMVGTPWHWARCGACWSWRPRCRCWPRGSPTRRTCCGRNSPATTSTRRACVRGWCRASGEAAHLVRHVISQDIGDSSVSGHR